MINQQPRLRSLSYPGFAQGYAGQAAEANARLRPQLRRTSQLLRAKAGFSVIEFVISIMISAMLMTASLTIYQQISRGMATIQVLTQEDIACTIVKNRLSLDLMGLCPLWFTAETQTSPTSPDTQPKAGQLTQEVQPKAITTEPQNPNAQKNNYLFAQSKDNQFTYLTFITTSTLQTYVNPQYRCVRVVYALKQDETKSKNKDQNNPTLFTLQRKQESKISNTFDKETITQGEFYTIAKNISKCVLEYGFIDASAQQREQQPEQEWKIKWVDHWGTSDNTPGNKNESNDYVPTLPDIIRVKLTIQENPDKPGKEHEFCCLLPQSKEATFQSFAQKRKLEQRNAKAASTPPGQPVNKDGTQPTSGGAKQPDNKDKIVIDVTMSTK